MSQAPLPPRRIVAHVMTSALTLSFLNAHNAFLKSTPVEYHILARFSGTRFDAAQDPGFHDIALTRSLLRPADLRGFWQLLRHLRKIRPDLLIVSTPKGALFGALAGMIAAPGRRRLFLVRGYRFPTLTGLRRWLVKTMEVLPAYLCHEVHCTSKETAETMRAMISPARGTRVKVVLNGTANGIDTQGVFAPDAPGIAPRAEVRARYGIAPSAKLVIFVGRVCVDKGMLELSEALEIVKARHPDMVLLVVGENDPADPLPHDAQARLDRLSIRAGRVENHLLPEVIAAADLLVFPSRREGFGIAAIEAAAMGTPTLAARVGGLQSAVSEGVSGRFFAVGDAEDLARKLDEILSDPAELARLRNTARAYAVTRFDKALYDQYWLNIYMGRGQHDQPA